MKKWDDLDAEEKKLKLKNLEETKKKYYYFYDHEGLPTVGGGGKYLKYVPESWGEPEGILIENIDKEKFKIHFFRLNMNLPPFVEESAPDDDDEDIAAKEWERIDVEREKRRQRNAEERRYHFGARESHALKTPEASRKAAEERYKADALRGQLERQLAEERAAAAAAPAAAAAAPQANLGGGDKLRKKKKRGGGRKKRTKKKSRKKKRKTLKKKRKRRKKKRKTRR